MVVSGMRMVAEGVRTTSRRDLANAMRLRCRLPSRFTKFFYGKDPHRSCYRSFSREKTYEMENR